MLGPERLHESAVQETQQCAATKETCVRGSEQIRTIETHIKLDASSCFKFVVTCSARELLEGRWTAQLPTVRY